MVATFFDASSTRFETLLAVFKGRQLLPNQHRDWFELLALLADNEEIKFYAGEYAAGRLTEEDVWGFQNSLGFVRGASLHAQFNSLINEVSNNQFVLAPRRDYEAEQKEMSH